MPKCLAAIASAQALLDNTLQQDAQRQDSTARLGNVIRGGWRALAYSMTGGVLIGITVSNHGLLFL